MTTPVPPRKKSALAGATVWSAPSIPAPGAVAPAAPTTKEQAEVRVSEHETARGRRRDPEEARGRKRTRDAAYAWAAAEHKALLRLQDFSAEMDAAMQRGTPPETIAEYIREACTRNGIDVGLLPPQIRTAAGLTD
ncbi:hypothetical protein [Nocardia sp. NPDC051463]|uniref:hypothetical protein n=1 Tax=Nocardia sp. NPDC051463 TaxID=3154845 RepID=UPI00344CA327